jgi:hypothetical protein
MLGTTLTKRFQIHRILTIPQRSIQSSFTNLNIAVDPKISKIVDEIATLNLLQASELVSALKV